VWLTAFGAALGLVVAVAGLRGRLPGGFVVIGFGMFALCLGMVAFVGWKTREEMLGRRDQEARRAMLVMLAARLRDEDAATLEAMARRRGPEAEAASLILKGRAERARRSGKPTG
jgi:hypothetical protein